MPRLSSEQLREAVERARRIAVYEVTIDMEKPFEEVLAQAERPSEWDVVTSFIRELEFDWRDYLEVEIEKLSEREARARYPEVLREERALVCSSLAYELGYRPPAEEYREVVSECEQALRRAGLI